MSKIKLLKFGLFFKYIFLIQRILLSITARQSRFFFSKIFSSAPTKSWPSISRIQSRVSRIFKQLKYVIFYDYGCELLKSSVGNPSPLFLLTAGESGEFYQGKKKTRKKNLGIRLLTRLCLTRPGFWTAKHSSCMVSKKTIIYYLDLQIIALKMSWWQQRNKKPLKRNIFLMKKSVGRILFLRGNFPQKKNGFVCLAYGFMV